MSQYPGRGRSSKGEGPDLLAAPAAAFSWLPGGKPAVHRGFLNSWRANGLNQRVKQRIWDILYGKDVDRSNVKVLCTGQLHVWRVGRLHPLTGHHILVEGSWHATHFIATL